MLVKCARKKPHTHTDGGFAFEMIFQGRHCWNACRTPLLHRPPSVCCQDHRITFPFLRRAPDWQCQGAPLVWPVLFLTVLLPDDSKLFSKAKSISGDEDDFISFIGRSKMVSGFKMEFSNFCPFGASNMHSRLPWWLSGKESACQCRRQGFHPLIQEDPTCCGATKPVCYKWVHTLEPRNCKYWAHVPQPLKPHALEPVLCKRSHCNEKPEHRN